MSFPYLYSKAKVSSNCLSIYHGVWNNLLFLLFRFLLQSRSCGRPCTQIRRLIGVQEFELGNWGNLSAGSSGHGHLHEHGHLVILDGLTECTLPIGKPSCHPARIRGAAAIVPPAVLLWVATMLAEESPAKNRPMPLQSGQKRRPLPLYLPSFFLATTWN